MASINAKIARPDERSDARERALYLLYEAHSKGISPADALSLQVLEPDELTVVLVTGVETHAAELDAAILKANPKKTQAEVDPVIQKEVQKMLG